MPVERPTFHESWYRVADLHPRLRNTVQISRQHFRGQPWHVIQDHSNNAFFRLAEPAYRFIGLLDGKRTVGDAWNLANEQLGDDAPTQGEAIQLLGQLYTSNLLMAEVAADTHTLFARYKKRKQREIAGYFMNIMFARIPIFDPDRFLNKWLPLLGWIFAPLGLVLWLSLIGMAVYFIAQYPNWYTKIREPAAGLLDPNNLVLLYLAFSLIKACHEMGHAISCKKFGKQSGTGGEVHIIGIMFMVFTPIPYVDASSSWALTNKWHRAIVGAAGMWVELAIASVAAIIWSHTMEGTTLHNFVYNIMFVAGFSTIVFNANPLLRYDGYYILSDILEIPNLAQRGKEYVYYLVKRYVWNVRFARNPAYGRAEKFYLFVYSIASFVMRIYVSISIMFYLTAVLNGVLIILAAGMAIAGLVTWAAVPLGTYLHYIFTNGELYRVRGRAILTSVLAIAALVVGLGVIRVPDRVRAQGVVEPDSDHFMEVYAGGDGAVVSVNPEPHASAGLNWLSARQGMPYILKDETLLVAANPDLALKRTQNAIDIQKWETQARIYLQDNKPGEAQHARSAAADLLGVQNMYDEQMAQLTVKAPLRGVFIAPDLETRTVAYVKRGVHLARIADLDDLIIRTAVSNPVAAMLREEGGWNVQVRVEGSPDVLFSGEIVKFAPAGSKDLPSPALSYQVGGEFTTAPDDQHGTKTQENFFEFRIGKLKLVDAPPRLLEDFKKPMNADDCRRHLNLRLRDIGGGAFPESAINLLAEKFSGLSRAEMEQIIDMAARSALRKNEALSTDLLLEALHAPREGTLLPLLPGQRVVVRFDLPPKPLAVQAWKKIRQVFQQRFQM